MTITHTKTWEVEHIRVSGDVGTGDVENRHLMYAIKHALLQGTAPWAVKLSCGKNGGGSLATGPTALVCAGVTLTGTSPVRLRLASHPLQTGDRIKCASFLGTTELNGNTYEVTRIDADYVDLDGTDSSDFSAYTSGGEVLYQDSVDRWTGVDDLAWSTGDHAWIVLEQENIGTHGTFQVLIDLNAAGSATENAYIYISPGGRFMDGAVNSRPTADDETAIVSNSRWGGTSGDNANKGVFCCKSDDGECTRVYTTTNECYCFWMFDTVQDPISGWTDPWIATVLVTDQPTVSSVLSSSFFADTRMAGASEKLFGTTLLRDTTPLVSDASGSVRTHDNSWVATKIGLDRDSETHNNVVGSIVDFWAISNGIPQGQYLEDAAPWTTVAVGTRFAQPWDGSTVWIW